MSPIHPASATLAYCETCNHVTVHDTSSAPHTCHVCAIKIVAQARKGN